MDASGAHVFSVAPYNNFSGCNCNQLNSNIAEATEARAAGTIAFASGHDQSGQNRVYVMNADGTGIKQITFHNPASSPRSHAAPEMSPDGTKVAFVNNEGLGVGSCATTNFGVLDIINVDGTGLHQIVGPTDPSLCNLGNVTEAVWNPTGTKLAFRQTGIPQNYGGAPSGCGTGVFIVNSDGSGLQNIACDNSINDARRGLDWSPDGSRIVALVGGGTAWNQYSAVGSFLKSIATPAGVTQSAVIRYSPDSTQLVYPYNSSNTSDTFVTMDLNGSNIQSVDARQIYGLVPDMAASFSWVPRGAIGTPTRMTLGPVTINVCPASPFQFAPSTFDADGGLITHGWTKAAANLVSGDLGSLTIDSFGSLSSPPGKNAGMFTLQVFQAVASSLASNFVSVNTQPDCSLFSVNVLSATPDSAPAGSAPITLTVTGEGFLTASTVNWNGSPIPTTFVSSSKLMATVGSALLTSAGTATLTVGRSNSIPFAILAPVVGSLSPASIATGSSQFTLTVNGSNFVSGSVVQFAGTPLSTVFVNSTQLTANVSASLVAGTGIANVTVVSSSSTSNAATFVIGTPALACTAGYPQTPQFRFETVTELLTNVVLTCTGGAAGQLVNANVSVTTNISLTSRILNGATQATEALLIIGNPAPAQQALNANIFQGTLTNANTITFSNVPIPAPGAGQTTLTIVNLRGNVHQLGQFSAKSPPFLNLSVAMSGGITLANPQLTAAYPPPTSFQVGSVSSGASGQRTFPIAFREGFAADFKTRVASGGQQNVLGTVYNTESGFVNTAVLPTAGLADSATRLIVLFGSVPSGVNVYAAVFPDGNTNAQLVSTDGNGAGLTSFVAGSSQFGGTYAPVSINGGSGIAVWEITSADPNAIETLQFHVVLTGMAQAGLGAITLAGSLAPLSGVTSASNVAAIPRFAADAVLDFVNLTLLSNSTAGSSYGTLSLPGYRPSQIRRQAAANVQVGSNLSFVYNLTNNGPGAAPQVSVASSLPPTLGYMSCTVTGSGACAANTNPDGSTTVIAEFNTVQPGQSPYVTINAQALGSGAGSTLTVPTVLSSGLTDSAPDDNVILTSFAVTSSAPPMVTVNFPSKPPGLQVQVGSAAAAVNPSVNMSQSASLTFTAPSPQAGPPGVQYVFNSWSDGVTTAAHPAVTPPIGGGSITANFDAQYQIAATASTGGAVALSPTTAGNFYSANAVVEIAATPSNGFAFAGFSGDVTGSMNPLNLVMPGKPLGIRANFVPMTLMLNPGTLNFGATPGETLVTSNQTVAVQVPPGSTWTAAANQPFISVMPAGGTGSGSFTVSMMTSALPASGTVSGAVTVTATGVSNSPQMATVSAMVAPSSKPFGGFDTPMDGVMGVAGAVPVTGWSLDSIEITKVDIWREPATGEAPGGGPNGLVYIGDAVFVTGARPDVQAANPNAPLNYRGGWGYLMLTNFLPNSSGTGALGNGTYKLHAIAHNKAGALTDLGTKTITVDNLHATKPFGTIDTPAQGGTISGTQYVNFGWALTQNPYCVPNDGSTLTVYIDGQALPGHPVYNNRRNDIATLFPGLCNSNGAIGFYILDTTQLANGAHTIFWIAYDNQNRADGLGSRYLNVFNTGTTASAPPDDPIDPPDPKFQNGRVAIEAEELDHLELKLGARSGYMQTPSGRVPLPIGSSLKRGTFYWHLGPGFTSTYSLVFQRPDGTEVQVSVKVRPKSLPTRR